MKTITIEWKHLVRRGRTCDRCGDTGANLRRAIRLLNTRCHRPRVHFRLKKTPLDPRRIAESNSILVDGLPLEQLLPEMTVAMSKCDSCGDLIGGPAECRALIGERGQFETVSTDLIVSAACRVAKCGSCTSDTSYRTL
jgi:hypothetical protein